MSSTERTTAAFHVLKLGGKTYRLSPLRDRDYGVFEGWVRDQSIAVVKRNLEGLAPEEQRYHMGEAYKQARLLTIASPEAESAMATVDGAIMLTWLSLRHEHPDITEDDVAELFTDPKALNDAIEMIERIEQLGGSQTSKKNPPKRKAPKRKARPKRKKK